MADTVISNNTTTVKKLFEKNNWKLVNLSDDADERTVDDVFCCDLLSIVMSRAPRNCVWVTVMGNVNVIAVAVLSEISCIVLAEGSELDAPALEKARSQGISVAMTDAPVFPTALNAHEVMLSAQI